MTVQRGTSTARPVAGDIPVTRTCTITDGRAPYTQAGTSPKEGEGRRARCA